MTIRLHLQGSCPITFDAETKKALKIISEICQQYFGITYHLHLRSSLSSQVESDSETKSGIRIIKEICTQQSKRMTSMQDVTTKDDSLALIRSSMASVYRASVVLRGRDQGSSLLHLKARPPSASIVTIADLPRTSASEEELQHALEMVQRERADVAQRQQEIDDFLSSLRAKQPSLPSPVTAQPHSRTAKVIDWFKRHWPF